MRNSGYDHRSFVCQKCGAAITGENYHSRFQCRRCRNTWRRDWITGKRADVKCDYNCIECQLPDCVLPVDYKAAECELMEGVW